MLSTKQAAEHLNVHQETIRRFLQRGIIKAVKVGKVWRVRESDLEEYLKQRR